MPQYRYVSLNEKGKEIERTVQASDISSAIALLKEQQQVIVSIEPYYEKSDSQGTSKKWFYTAFQFFQFVRPYDIVLFFRQLSSLLRSGISIRRSLDILTRQVHKERMREMLKHMIHDIEEGNSFAYALQLYPTIFSSFFVGMIEVGELTGGLTEVLDSISRHISNTIESKRKLITALIYPVVVVLVSIGVVGFLVGFVIPRFTPFITMRGNALPWNAQLLVDLSKFVQCYWMHMIGGTLTCGIFLYYVARWDKAKYAIDNIKLRIPILGKAFRYALVIEFSRNLSLLLQSGISIVKALASVRRSLSNAVAMRVIDSMEVLISEGEDISGSLKHSLHVFPPMVRELIAIGEETGNVDESLKTIMYMYEESLETYMERLQGLTEPILIIIIGAIVGFVAWALVSSVLTVYGV